MAALLTLMNVGKAEASGSFDLKSCALHGGDAFAYPLQTVGFELLSENGQLLNSDAFAIAQRHGSNPRGHRATQAHIGF